MAIDNFNATGFNRNITRTVEQKGGIFRPLVKLATGDLYREKGIYPRITGGGRPSAITNRFPDSPVSEATYGNRSVTRKDYNDGQFADRADLDRMVVDPRSEKLDIMLQKFRREEDLLIVKEALGVAQGGDLGATNVAFGATGKGIVAVTLGAASGYTNAGFTYEKLTETIEGFLTSNVDISMNRPTIAIGPQQMNDILQQDKFINKDYINQALVSSGWKIPNYMGCDFVVTNMVPYAADSTPTIVTDFNIDLTDDVDSNGVWQDTNVSDVRVCFAMCKDAVLFEVKPEIITKVSERADKSYRWYAYMEMGFGAVRMEEEKVIAIPCDQSPA